MEPIKHFHSPTISESLGNGWYTLKKYFIYLLVAVIVSGIFDGGFNIFRFNSKSGYFGQGMGCNLAPNWEMFIPAALFMLSIAIVVGLAITFLVRPVISYGADYMFLEGVRNNQPQIKNLFVGFQRNYLQIVVANLLATLIIVTGFIFLIIPGIIFACRLFMIPYLVMDKKLGAIEAIETSWRMTKTHGWKIFGLGITSFFIIILGLALLFIGVFPALIWVRSSFASMYQAILIQRETAIQ